MSNQNESEVECVCEECGDEYPIERRRVAYHHPHLCVSCAEAIPISYGQQFTLVPMHKGAYQPVRRDKIYEVACNPKNFDPEKGGL